MKVFSTYPPAPRAFVDAQLLQDEGRRIARTMNGGVGSEQMPYESISADKFVAPADIDSTVRTTPAGATTATASELASQIFAITQTDIVDLAGFNPPDGGAGNTGILGPPSASYQTNSSAWGPGWNRLSDTVAEGVYLQWPARAGVVSGALLVDWEFYLGDASSYGLGAAPTGSQWRWQVGVFVDGVLVARSGRYPPRRHTVHLPFTVPVPSRSVVVDVRWQASYDGAGTSNAYSYSADTVLRVYNASLWIRNQYR